MKIHSIYKKKFCKMIFGTLVLLLLTSCGGGTLGTGGDSSIALNRVDGVVINERETPISGVSVSIDGNSDLTITDDDGSFTLDIDNQDALNFDENTNEVILDIRISADIGGQNNIINTQIFITVDASESLADIQITIDVPDELIEAIENFQDSDAQTIQEVVDNLQ